MGLDELVPQQLPVAFCGATTFHSGSLREQRHRRIAARRGCGVSRTQSLLVADFCSICLAADAW